MKVEPTSLLFVILIAILYGLFGAQDSTAVPKGTIAFLSNRNSAPPNKGWHTTIYLINADGSDERIWLEDPKVWFGKMALSPDSKQVALDIMTDFSRHVYVIDIATGQRQNLTEPFGEHQLFAWPTWSGDGKWLASICYQPGDKHNDVCIMDLAGKVLRNVTRRADDSDSSPSWSPDSSKIAYSSRRGKGRGIWNTEIYVMDINGGNQTNLTNHRAWDRYPRWSPDGQQILFYSNRELNQDDIYVMNADGTDVVNLTRHPSEDRTHAWSPDGNWITFMSTRDGNWNIYIMEVNGENQTRVTSHPGTESSPIWITFDTTFSVTSQGKLPTVWGGLKAETR